MFFYASKILSGLFFPYPLFFIVCFLLIRKVKDRRLQNKFKFLLLLLYLISFYPVSGGLMRFLETRYEQKSLLETPRTQAIVLLGGMVNPMIHNRDANPEFNGSVDRLIKSEQLLINKKAPLLLISAGSGFMLTHEKKEADILKIFLLNRGHSPDQIISENKSRNTYENAKFSKKILLKKNINKIILVTSAFHMPRSVLCYEAQGFEVVPIPTDYFTSEPTFVPEMFFPSPSALRMSTIAIKEYLGIVAYYLAGHFSSH